MVLFWGIFGYFYVKNKTKQSNCSSCIWRDCMTIQPTAESICHSSGRNTFLVVLMTHSNDFNLSMPLSSYTHEFSGYILYCECSPVKTKQNRKKQLKQQTLKDLGFDVMNNKKKKE